MKDRYGENIEIYVSDGKVTKKIDENLGKRIFQRRFREKLIYLPEFIFNYTINENLTNLFDGNFILNLYYSFLKNRIKIEPKYFIIKIGKKRYHLYSKKTSEIIALINQVFVNDQYNIKNIAKDKIIIDVGANIGDFSIYAAKMGAKKVYAFEPVPETFEILKRNIKLNKLENKIIPINEALGNEKGEIFISFKYAGDGGGKLKPDNKENQKKRNKRKEIKNKKVKITTLDDFVRQNKIPGVDFIKMDVEGYEENVLLGAKETIKKWKPILSFSAYHLPTDKERLPQIVKSIRPDYKIKLNKFAEEDFYCW